ncbi:MAG: hypothetical protein FWG07_07270 [Treponema sp.]|nr:hypothetical protein [Treponema sp.]
MCYGYHPVGISVYNRNKDINIIEYKNHVELYITYDHYLLGIYDNFLFLLSMGNSLAYRDFIIIDLNNKEMIYSGQYIWDLGINVKDSYNIETYEYFDESIYNDGYNRVFIFDQYSFNLITKEKKNMNRKIEIIGK